MKGLRSLRVRVSTEIDCKSRKGFSCLSAKVAADELPRQSSKLLQLLTFTSESFSTLSVAGNAIYRGTFYWNGATKSKKKKLESENNNKTDDYKWEPAAPGDVE